MSESPSPIRSSHRSSGQRTPITDSLAPPPTGQSAASRSRSKHRKSAGQISRASSTRAQQYSNQISQPYSTPGPHSSLAHVQGQLIGQPPTLAASHVSQHAGNQFTGGQFVGALAPSHQHPIVPASGPIGQHIAPTTVPSGVRKKRIIIACDGTWKSADSANLKGDAIKPSNVVHLTRAIKSISRDGISQVVFYQAGVGTEGGPINRLVGGVTAKGLEDDILQGYYWLCQNWMPGDEIFLFGFSRGAFTSRSIAGLVDGVGLLTRDGIKHINAIFKDFENRNDPNYRSDSPDQPFRNKPSASDPKYLKLLQRYQLSRLDIPIKVIACFDTVGSLGIPRIPALERLGLQSRGTKEYEFSDTGVGNHVEHAFQALALDEQRGPFSPCLWEKAPGNSTDLRQVWFPGVHTNVGGGYPDSNLSNISLAWMMAQLTPFLDLDDAYILEQAQNNALYYKVMEEQARPWSFGRLYNSLTGIWVLGGRRPRTPGMYYGTSGAPLRETNEYVHASARSRFMMDGTGYRDMGLYRPIGLEGYRLRLTGTAAGQSGSVALWESRRKTRNGPKKVLTEAPLFEIERRLLGLSPRVEKYVLQPRLVEEEKNSRRSRHARRRTRQGSDLAFDEEKMASRASI